MISNEQTFQPTHLTQEPLYLSDEESPYDRSSTLRCNATTRRVFTVTERHYQDGDLAASLYRLMTNVRWGLLKYSRTEFASRAGISPWGVDTLESSWKVGSQRELMTRALHHWQRENVRDEFREFALNLLCSMHGGVNGICWMMRYDLGKALMEKALKIKEHALVARCANGVVPDLFDLEASLKSAYSEKSQATRLQTRLVLGRTLWRESREAQCRQRNFPDPVRKLLISTEEYLAALGIKMTEEQLYKRFNLRTEDADRLYHGEWVPWEYERRHKNVPPQTRSIRDLAGKILQADEAERLGGEWQAGYTENQSKPGFTRTIRLLMQAHQISPGDLIYAHRIKRKRERRDGKEGDGSYNNTSCIVSLLRDGTSAQTPPCSVIALLCDDENLARKIRSEYEAERCDHYVRRGWDPATQRLEVRLARDWNGIISRQELAVRLKNYGFYPRLSLKEVVQRIDWIERGIIPDHNLQRGEIVNIRKTIDAIGNERTSFALSHQRCQSEGLALEACKQCTTLTELVLKLSVACGSITGVYERLSRDAEIKSHIGQYRLYQMAKGKDYPPLPQVRQMLRTFGLTLTEALKNDWYSLFSIYACSKELGESMLQWPLVRLLFTLIGSVAVSPTQFDERLSHHPTGFTSTVLRRLRQNHLPRLAGIVENELVELLLALDLQDQDFHWRLALALHRSQQDIAAVVHSMKDEIRTLPINHCTFPGFTTAELQVVSAAIKS